MWKTLIGRSSGRSEASESRSDLRKSSKSSARARPDSPPAIQTGRKSSRNEDARDGFQPVSSAYSSTSRSAFPGTAAPSVASSYATADTHAQNVYHSPELYRNGSVNDEFTRARTENTRGADRESRPEKGRRQRSSSRERKPSRRSSGRDQEPRRKGSKGVSTRKDSLGESGKKKSESGRYEASSRAIDSPPELSGYSHHPSIPLVPVTDENFDPHIPHQFPGQFPDSSSAPYRPPGLAADYYGDHGESVADQPGVRPAPPSIIVGAEPHLHEATIEAAPPPEPSSLGQVGAAASFFANNSDFETELSPGKPSNTSGLAQNGRPSPRASPGPEIESSGVNAEYYMSGGINGGAEHTLHGSQPERFYGPNVPQTYSDRPPQSSNQISSSSNAALYGAAAGAAGAYAEHASHGSHMNGYNPDTPQHHTQQPQKPPKHSSGSSNAALYGAAAVAAGAYAVSHNSSHGLNDNPLLVHTQNSAYGGGDHHHHAEHSSFGNSHFTADGSQTFLPQHKHRHRGPLRKVVDFFKDPEGVSQYEEYTEYIGVCRYCFDPHSSPRDAPRRHRYKRRLSGGGRHGSSSRVDKLSRYSSSDEDRRRKSGQKSTWAAAGTAGLAGYGLAQAGKSMLNKKDFDDTYSVQSGRPLFDDSQHGHRVIDGDHATRRGKENYVQHGVTRRSSLSDPRQGSSTRITLVDDETRSRKSTRSRRSSSSSGSSYKRQRMQHVNPSTSNVDLTTDVSSGFGSFFTAPSANVRKSHKRSRKGFFTFGNSSSSSSDADLAFGGGRVRRKSNANLRQRSRKDQNADAAILGLGATAAALAAASASQSRKEKQRADLVAVKEPRHKSHHVNDSRKRVPASRASHPSAGGDSDWEDASDDDVGSVDSALAFGLSRESLVSKGSEADKWFGEMDGESDKKPFRRKQSSFVDQGASVPHAGDIYSRPAPSVNSSSSLQQVFPFSTSDPTMFDVTGRASVASSGPQSRPYVARPGVPLQQPQPIAPVSSSVYDASGPSLQHPDRRQFQPSVPSQIMPHTSVIDSPTQVTEKGRDRTQSGSRRTSRNVDDPRSSHDHGFSVMSTAPEPIEGSILSRRSTSKRDRTASVKFDVPDESAERQRRDRDRERRRAERKRSDSDPMARSYSPTRSSRTEEKSHRRRSTLDHHSEERPYDADLVDNRSNVDSKPPALDYDDIERELERLRDEEDKQNAEKRRKSSEGSWATPIIAAGLAGTGVAVATAAVAESVRINDDDLKESRRRSRKNSSSRKYRDTSPSHETATEEENPESRSKKQKRLAKMAASRVKTSPVYDSYGDFFTPEELRTRSTDVHNVSLDSTVPNIVEVSPASPLLFEFDKYHPFGSQPGEDPKAFPWPVPRLGLVQPTPPVSISGGSVRGDASPVIVPVEPSVVEEPSQATPHEEDVSNSKVIAGHVDPDYSASERNAQDKHSDENLSRASRRKKKAEAPESVHIDSSEVPKDGEYGQDLEFAAALAAGAERAGFDPSIVIDDPKYHSRDSRPASDMGRVYEAPYVETTSDFGTQIATYSTAPTVGFVEGEVESPSEARIVRPADSDGARSTAESNLPASEDERIHPQPRIPGSYDVFDYFEGESPAVGPKDESAPFDRIGADEAMSRVSWSSSKIKDEQGKDASANIEAKTPSVTAENVNGDFFTEVARQRETRKSRPEDFDLPDTEIRSVAASAPDIDEFADAKRSRRKSTKDPGDFANIVDAATLAHEASEVSKSRKSKKKSKKGNDYFDDVDSVASSPAKFGNDKGLTKNGTSSFFDVVKRASDVKPAPEQGERDGNGMDIVEESFETPRKKSRKKSKRKSLTEEFQVTDDNDIHEEIQEKAIPEEDEKSFLGERPEMPLITETGASGPTALSSKSAQDLRSPSQAEVEYDTTKPSSSIRSRSISPKSTGKVVETKSQAHSRPGSPSTPEVDKSLLLRRLSALQTSDLQSSAIASSSPTAVPINFRRLPLTPGHTRTGSTGSPSLESPDTPQAIIRTRQPRPRSMEFRSSKEFRPLFLVEQHSYKKEAEPTETYPSLPSSRTSSTHPSIENLREVADREVEISRDSNHPSDNFSMQPNRYSWGSAPRPKSPDYLNSQQTTPTQSEFPEETKKSKPKYEFHSPSELLEDPSFQQGTGDGQVSPMVLPTLEEANGRDVNESPHGKPGPSFWETAGAAVAAGAATAAIASVVRDESANRKMERLQSLQLDEENEPPKSKSWSPQEEEVMKDEISLARSSSPTASLEQDPVQFQDNSSKKSKKSRRKEKEQRERQGSDLGPQATHDDQQSENRTVGDQPETSDKNLKGRLQDASESVEEGLTGKLELSAHPSPLPTNFTTEKGSEASALTPAEHPSGEASVQEKHLPESAGQIPSYIQALDSADRELADVRVGHSLPHVSENGEEHVEHRPVPADIISTGQSPADGTMHDETVRIDHLSTPSNEGEASTHPRPEPETNTSEVPVNPEEATKAPATPGADTAHVHWGPGSPTARTMQYDPSIAPFAMETASQSPLDTQLPVQLSEQRDLPVVPESIPLPEDKGDLEDIRLSTSPPTESPLEIAFERAKAVRGVASYQKGDVKPESFAANLHPQDSPLETVLDSRDQTEEDSSGGIVKQDTDETASILRTGTRKNKKGKRAKKVTLDLNEPSAQDVLDKNEGEASRAINEGDLASALPESNIADVAPSTRSDVEVEKTRSEQSISDIPHSGASARGPPPVEREPARMAQDAEQEQPLETMPTRESASTTAVPIETPEMPIKTSGPFLTPQDEKGERLSQTIDESSIEDRPSRSLGPSSEVTPPYIETEQSVLDQTMLERVSGPQNDVAKASDKIERQRISAEESSIRSPSETLETSRSDDVLGAPTKKSKKEKRRKEQKIAHGKDDPDYLSKSDEPIVAKSAAALSGSDAVAGLADFPTRTPVGSTPIESRDETVVDTSSVKALEPLEQNPKVTGQTALASENQSTDLPSHGSQEPLADSAAADLEPTQSATKDAEDDVEWASTTKKKKGKKGKRQTLDLPSPKQQTAPDEPGQDRSTEVSLPEANSVPSRKAGKKSKKNKKKLDLSWSEDEDVKAEAADLQEPTPQEPEPVIEAMPGAASPPITADLNVSAPDPSPTRAVLSDVAPAVLGSHDVSQQELPIAPTLTDLTPEPHQSANTGLGFTQGSRDEVTDPSRLAAEDNPSEAPTQGPPDVSEVKDEFRPSVSTVEDRGSMEHFQNDDNPPNSEAIEPSWEAPAKKSRKGKKDKKKQQQKVEEAGSPMTLEDEASATPRETRSNDDPSSLVSILSMDDQPQTEAASQQIVDTALKQAVDEYSFQSPTEEDKEGRGRKETEPDGPSVAANLNTVQNIDLDPQQVNANATLVSLQPSAPSEELPAVEGVGTARSEQSKAIQDEETLVSPAKKVQEDKQRRAAAGSPITSQEFLGAQHDQRSNNVEGKGSAARELQSQPGEITADPGKATASSEKATVDSNKATEEQPTQVEDDEFSWVPMKKAKRDKKKKKSQTTDLVCPPPELEIPPSTAERSVEQSQELHSDPDRFSDALENQVTAEPIPLARPKEEKSEDILWTTPAKGKKGKKNKKKGLDFALENENITGDTALGDEEEAPLQRSHDRADSSRIQEEAATFAASLRDEIEAAHAEHGVREISDHKSTTELPAGNSRNDREGVDQKLDMDLEPRQDPSHIIEPDADVAAPALQAEKLIEAQEELTVEAKDVDEWSAWPVKTKKGKKEKKKKLLEQDDNTASDGATIAPTRTERALETVSAAETLGEEPFELENSQTQPEQPQEIAWTSTSKKSKKDKKKSKKGTVSGSPDEDQLVGASRTSEALQIEETEEPLMARKDAEDDLERPSVTAEVSKTTLRPDVGEDDLWSAPSRKGKKGKKDKKKKTSATETLDNDANQTILSHAALPDQMDDSPVQSSRNVEVDVQERGHLGDAERTLMTANEVEHSFQTTSNENDQSQAADTDTAGNVLFKRSDLASEPPEPAKDSRSSDNDEKLANLEDVSEARLETGDAFNSPTTPKKPKKDKKKRQATPIKDLAPNDEVEGEIGETATTEASGEPLSSKAPSETTPEEFSWAVSSKKNKKQKKKDERKPQAALADTQEQLDDETEVDTRKLDIGEEQEQHKRTLPANSEEDLLSIPAKKKKKDKKGRGKGAAALDSSPTQDLPLYNSANDAMSRTPAEDSAVVSSSRLEPEGMISEALDSRDTGDDSQRFTTRNDGARLDLDTFELPAQNPGQINYDAPMTPELTPPRGTSPSRLALDEERRSEAFSSILAEQNVSTHPRAESDALDITDPQPEATARSIDSKGTRKGGKKGRKDQTGSAIEDLDQAKDRHQQEQRKASTGVEPSAEDLAVSVAAGLGLASAVKRKSTSSDAKLELSHQVQDPDDPREFGLSHRFSWTSSPRSSPPRSKRSSPTPRENRDSGLHMVDSPQIREVHQPIRDSGYVASPIASPEEAPDHDDTQYQPSSARRLRPITPTSSNENLREERRRSIRSRKSSDDLGFGREKVGSGVDSQYEHSRSQGPRDVTAAERDTPPSPPTEYEPDYVRGSLDSFPETPARRHPSPVDSTSKDRSSGLFDSSPSARTPRTIKTSSKESGHLRSQSPNLHRSPSVHRRSSERLHHESGHRPSSPQANETRHHGPALGVPDYSGSPGTHESSRSMSPMSKSLGPIPEDQPVIHHDEQDKGLRGFGEQMPHAPSPPRRADEAISDSALTSRPWPRIDDAHESISFSPQREQFPETGKTSRDPNKKSAKSLGEASSDPTSRAKASDLDFSPSQSQQPVNDQKKEKGRGMADTFDGWGAAPGSPMSPTRPQSMRKRQSMQQIQDLEAKIEQMASENRLLATAKISADKNLEDFHFTQSRAESASREALETRDVRLREKDADIAQLRQSVQHLEEEVKRLTEINAGLTATNAAIEATHARRYAELETEHNRTSQTWQESSRELEDLRQQHTQLSSGMEEIVRHEIQTATADRDSEIERLKGDLEMARGKIRELQQQILASSKSDDILSTKDEDYFEHACEQLCQRVQLWVVKFSKLSDTRVCRLTSEVRDEKYVDRFENALLDDHDVNKYLADRVKRRDVFMSVVMMMIWEYIFTRYLFGMDREQRQKLKSLEKQLSEVGPPRAVRRWRALTLTLLTQRESFKEQRASDIEGVVLEIFKTLSKFLPPSPAVETQLLDSLRNVIRMAVDLSIDMRTQRAEFIMLPPHQPEYDENGDLAQLVYFNAALMNERSGDTVSNEDLESQQAVVRMVLFPPVFKKGSDSGDGEEEIVVCPAQVLVARQSKDKKVVRIQSGDRMSIDAGKSVHSVAPSSMDMGNVI